MKRLLTVCLLIVLIAVCAPLHALVPAARAAQQTVPDEIKLLRYAQALYDDMIIAHPTAQQYRIYQWNRKEFYRDKLAKAKTYNFTYDYFINISGALIDIGVGFLTGDVGKMVGGVAGMYVDEAYNAMIDKLKLTAPMSVKDYIYAQAESALNAIELGTIENVMERAQNNGGKLVSYADAAELVYAHLKNELHFSTMAMGTGYYDKQLSQGPADAIRDLMVKISLSEIAGKISQNSFTLSTLEGFLLNFEYQFLDGIGQQAHEPCVTQWIKEQKSIMDEFKKFAGGEDVVALRDLTHPSWIDSDAGKWTSVSGEACEMEIKSLDGVSSMQLYFPATGQTETAVFAGIDSRHRAVYLNAEHATVISYSGTGDEINLWINPYDGNSFGGSRQDRSATFIRQEYAWAGHWVNTENPETVLDITSNGDGTLHLDAHFAPDLSFAFDFPPEDYELLYFDTLEQPFPADMRIDGYTGMLEFNIFADLNFGWLNVDTSRYERFAQYAGTYFFTTDNPPDLTRFGWIPYDDPISLSDEETRQLFSRLSETPLMAASGAGAWEGRLKVNPDGTFSGYYYDADFDTVYEVSFSGHFSSSVEFDGNAYWLWVEEVTTAQTPGDTAQSEYGDTIIYDEPLFYGGEYLLLTLPGTPNDFIPEEVQGEIGGVYGEWEDYSRFITLTRLDDGWGFFADPNDPPAYDLEPIPVAGEEEFELNWTGIWVNKQDANSRLYAYQQAGSGGEEYQTIQTMERNGRAVAFQGGFYPVDEITVEYYSEGLLHSGVVQDPVGRTLSLTVFSALDDAMLPWVACLEGDYEYIGPLDDPDSQIPASVWELARNGLNPMSDPAPTAAPTAAPSDQLPKNVSRLPNGNLRYDDGVIAFEITDDARIVLPIAAVDGVQGWSIFMPRPADYNKKLAQQSPYSLNEDGNEAGELMPVTIRVTNVRSKYWQHYGLDTFDAESLTRHIVSNYSQYLGGAPLDYGAVTLPNGMNAWYIQRNPGLSLGKTFDYYIQLSEDTIASVSSNDADDAHFQDAISLLLRTLGFRVGESSAPTAVPTAAPTEAPAAPDLSAWTGYWMTHDDSFAEMIITNNGNGTLHAKALFLPAGDHEATLTPQGDGSMRFESQYGHLIGSLIRQADGGLRLTFTGGTTMEDEEATEYQGYFAQGFTYYPATYADMWYQTPEDAAATEDDWLGYWTAMNGDGVSALQISRMNGQLMVDVTLGRYHFSGPADTGSDSIMAVYDDDFCCLLLLNNKLNKIAMLEVDTSIEEVYDITGNPYYGVLIFQKTPDINTYLTPDQIDALLNAEVPPTLIMPVPTQAPQNIALLPIPGKAGCMQVPISRADATSYIVGSKDPTAYAPFRMIDGEGTTSFQFSTKTTPLGQVYLYFDFDGPVTLDELWMKNGFWKITDGKDQYTRNSRVKKMTIFVRFAGSGDYQLLKDVSLKDDSARKDWKVIDMLGVQNVTGVRIRIDEIFKGSKFPTDVCISEIMFVQRAN